MIGFRPDLSARFISRPNRFVVIAGAEAGEIRAHCPNPGRLLEILTPGREIFLEDCRSATPPSPPSAGRKTRYTLVGARYKEKIIPLYSGRANAVAQELLISELFPGTFKIFPEYTRGASRFDFFLKSSMKERYLEVKACTLCEEGTAMFPDAPTARGLRHVEEIASLSGNCTGGTKTEGDILFVVMHADAERFVPNIHTDPEFSLALYRYAMDIAVHAASVHADEDGDISLVSPSLPVDLSPAGIVEENCGIYLIVTFLETNKIIAAGSLGRLDFAAGYYVYVGSAKKNLAQRIARHLRKTKQLRWHIDYLIAESAKTKAFPIRTYKNLECDLAEDLSQIADRSVRKFGCSDCTCPSHLFYFSRFPVQDQRFLDTFLSYRHRRAFD